MPFTIALFILLCIVNYTVIAYVGQLLGGKTLDSAWEAFLHGFSPLPAILVAITNPVFAVALYYGFSISRFAIPMAIAVGVCTSFVYSIIFLGATVTLTKMLGLLTICFGIALLAL